MSLELNLEPSGVAVLLDLIKDDSYAVCFQSMGQYRAALIDECRRQMRAQQRRIEQAMAGVERMSITKVEA